MALKYIEGFGADEDLSERPGVPMELEPRPLDGVHWDQPDRQPETVRIFKRVGLDKLTPVFGTKQPPRGLSGAMRSAAYRIPEHKAAHWALLLAADRVDVAEGRVIDAFTRKPYLGYWLIGGGVAAVLFSQRKYLLKKASR